ncbi:MAG: preprotein translocase subunit SecG [Eubacteriaceae bacterium]|jgi:preprotein translocase subunit SecG|nr:preprotein translocase subunit SecG [Eubacteriaceae bacterium]
MQLFLSILIFASSLVLILSVLLQEGKGYGMGASIGGTDETLFGKSKARGLQAMLQRLTVFSGALLMLSIFMFNVVLRPGLFD